MSASLTDASTNTFMSPSVRRREGGYRWTKRSSSLLAISSRVSFIPPSPHTWPRLRAAGPGRFGLRERSVAVACAVSSSPVRAASATYRALLVFLVPAVTYFAPHFVRMPGGPRIFWIGTNDDSLIRMDHADTGWLVAVFHGKWARRHCGPFAQYGIPPLPFLGELDKRLCHRAVLLQHAAILLPPPAPVKKQARGNPGRLPSSRPRSPPAGPRTRIR